MFPRELVERILVLLNLKLVLTCRLVNKEFNQLIQTSTLVQYFLACEAAGVVDNPRSPLSYPERFKALKKREDAWKKLKPVFETTIRLNHQPPSIWPISALTGGAYFHDDNNRKNLHYCPLPSSPQDNPRWTKIRAYPGEGWSGEIVNFALSEYEDDLMINVISSDIGYQPEMLLPDRSIDLVLLKFSTGEYHPLARHPQIHLQRSHFSGPRVIPRVVGENIALVVRPVDLVTPDKLLIFDWKTGHKRLHHETTANTYRDLDFVSPELLLVPNLILSHFEVWHIPPSNPNPNPPVQVLSLKLPILSPDYSLFGVGFNGMPNPFLKSMPYSPLRPFFPSQENSIIAVNLRLGAFPETRNVSYTLIMYRGALLDTIKKWTSPSSFEQQLDLPIWLSNDITVHERADPDGGSVRFDVQSMLVSTIPHTRSFPRTGDSSTFSASTTSPISHIDADSLAISSTTSSDSKCDFRQVQWADWGPPISRLLQVSEMQAELIVTSAGQRYAFAVPSPRVWGIRISVADFNPYNVRGSAAKMVRLRGDNGDSDNSDNKGKTKEEEWETLDHEGVFAEDVYMGLKCAIYHAPGDYECEQLLMDEERLVGLKIGHNGRTESVKVLYIG